jgi:UDPglucose 6-dehydrogenase
MVSTPEFLCEGHAVHDFRNPDRVVIGTYDDAAAHTVRRAFGVRPQSVLRMSPESAELAKYASNAFLAVKLSYANSLATLCARVGADIGEVTGCMGAEVEAARATNAAQADRLAGALRQAMARPLEGSRVTVLGLTFKAGTSDTRDSPALSVCARLTGAGAQVLGHDPRLDSIDPGVLQHLHVTAVDDPYRATKAADAIVVLTEWLEFRELDWAAIAREAPTAVVLDTRNLLDGALVAAAGLTYLGNGMKFGF